MSGFLQFEVQKAIDSRLIADSYLLSLLGTGDSNSILDNPTEFESIAYPFISFDINEAIPFDTKNSIGQDVNIQLSVWSRSGDKEESMIILKRIYDILHNSYLSITGGDDILLKQSGASSVIIDDSDRNLLYHGFISFRTLTEGI